MSYRISDRVLHRYLAGALTPPRRAEVDDALRDQPALRARLAALRQDEAQTVPPVWRLPPPRVPVRGPLSAQLERVAAMGDEARYGALRFDPGTSRDTHWILLLARRTEGWAVLFPTSAAQVRTVASLPREADGQIRLDVQLEGDGPWRFGIALVPPEVGVDWTLDEADRWTSVRDALAAGRVDVRTVELD